MKILHTSDWHIGRTFHGVDLLADQASVLGSIADSVREHGVDVVVVPGDIYDRSIPSSDAVTVCNRGFEAIRAAGAVIVATSGNHDSAVRLGAGASFAAAGGLHLITRVGQIGTPVMLSDQFGPVAFYGIPYLEPEITRVELDVPRARTHSDILGAAMSRVRRDLSERTATDPSTRSVLLAHAFVVGGEASESERSISVGGVETVAVGDFDGVDYVALGHLHSPQMLSESVRYSGSPLPYSFGERSHRKAALLIELDAAGLSSVQRLDLPVIRGLSQVVGTLDELLTESKYADSEQCYVSALLTDPVRPVDAMRQLQARFPFAVHLEWQRPEGQSDLKYRDAVRGRTDMEIARGFVSAVRSDPSEREVSLMTEALSAAARAEESTVELGETA
ncbi:exonuclease SbcCD subunit D [Rhodococcus erythropolis]|uniref:exonuclease SbcCD subunit D n=1 Tax=Rhodococcus erythropolis TaxID=1833 RepID=UPI001BEC7D1A|nr:exonuclease SbcCD subunit D [Rhodococcus erythropolis]MBT2266281.1 exonuclease SbcCD subunit D [Rhodococcus erythropolis]